MIKIAKNTAKEALRNVKDYHLSRYGCYLIAQNGDPRKQEIKKFLSNKKAVSFGKV